MSSIIEGYNYDIFISYRQKDNKHDCWVTKFVDNLKGELEATIKEDVSVYFDENPHDRLQDTHNVDKSLEGKLICLIFIPILSKTYCDPNSYAWQYEMLTFIRMAEQDRFGKDVSLRSGNVASRILPIRIHDLEPDDIKLFEKETGSVLRAMDFVFKTASGVNRPLKSNEDHPLDNLNKTFYGDQINKVANAIDEIIHSLNGKQPTPADRKLSSDQLYYDTEEDKRKELAVATIINSNSKRWLILLLSVFFCIVAAFIVIKITERSNKVNSDAKLEKSIAVLPFKLLSDEPDKQYLADGMMDAITLHLSKLKDLRVMSRTSVEQYRGTTKTTRIIGHELDVQYLLEGSFQKNGDNVRLIVQLIKANEENHVWANEYNNKWSDIFSLQSEVAQKIAGELNAAISPEEKRLIERAPTGNLTAYDFYQRGREEHQKYWSDNTNREALQRAEELYRKALKFDTTFAKAYGGLSLVYMNKNYLKEYFSRNFMDSVLILANIALSFDDHLDEAYFAKGVYFEVNGQNDEALNNFDKALNINPNLYLVYSEKGYILRTVKFDYVKAIDNLNKALTLCHGEDRPVFLRLLADTYIEIGFIDKAKYYYEEAFALDNNKRMHQYNLIGIEYYSENLEEAVKLNEKAMETDSSFFFRSFFIYLSTTGHNEEEYILAKKCIEYFKSIHSTTGFDFNVWTQYIGYAFWQAGKKKEAEYYFNQKIKYWGEGLKLGRNMSNDTYYGLAETYAFLGNKDKAYQYLNGLNKSIFYDLGYLIGFKHSQLFAGIRNEERFQKFLNDMEAKYQAEHERVGKWLEE